MSEFINKHGIITNISNNYSLFVALEQNNKLFILCFLRFSKESSFDMYSNVNYIIKKVPD